MSDELLNMHSTNAVQKTLKEAKELRDRIFTWTDEAVDEIRAAGLFVIRNENRPDWLAIFRSTYALAKGWRSKLKRVTPAAEATTPVRLPKCLEPISAPIFLASEARSTRPRPP